MKSKIVSLSAALFLAASSAVFAQHPLQLDNGADYTIIQGSSPGGTYIIPPGGGTFLTVPATPTSLAWLQGGNLNGAPPIPNYGTLGTLDNVDLNFITNGLANTRMTIFGNGNISMNTLAGDATIGRAGSGATNLNSPTISIANIGTAATLSNILVRNGNNMAVSTLSAIGGSGTVNAIPRFTPDGTTLGDSRLTDDGGASITANANFIPTTDNTRLLGDATHRWQSIYVGPSSLHIVNTAPVRDYALGSSVAGDFTITEGANPTEFSLTQSGNARFSGNTLNLNAATTGTTGYQIAGTTVLHNSGLNNIFVGAIAGAVATGADNTGVGQQALTALTTGTDNVGVGYGAGGALTTGSSNVVIGMAAMVMGTTPSQNVAIGKFALFGVNGAGNTNNVGVGFQSGNNVSSGTNSVYLGANAGNSGASTTGSNNTIIGASAGQLGGANTSFSSVTLLGQAANMGANNLTNATAIGANAVVSTSNTVQLGAASVTNVNVPQRITSQTATHTAMPAASASNELVTSNAGALETRSVASLNLAANNEPFITAANTGTLSNERALANGAGISLTDGGANSTMTIANTGVLSAIGTANQVNVSGATGNVTFSLPQNINTGASPQFANVNLTGIPASSAFTNIVVSNGGLLQTRTIGSLAWALGGNTAPTSNIFGTLSATDVLMQTGGATQLTLRSAGGIELPATTAAGVGVVYQNGFPFIHSYGGNNSFIGSQSGNFTLSGSYNSAVGYSALQNLNNGDFNSAFGAGALRSNTTGYQNTATGGNALYSNIDGFQNTAVGLSSLYSNTTGFSNVAVGAYTLIFNVNGNTNTAIGRDALSANISGSQNVANGFQALFTNSTGNLNTATGVNALYTSNGSLNCGFGKDALYSTTSGSNNVGVGYQAGVNNTTGSNNTFVGDNANAGAGNLTNASAFGNAASVCANNNMVFGNASVIGWGFGTCASAGNAIVVGTNATNGNGARLTTGGVWTNGSSRSFKDRFTPLSGAQILSKISALNVLGWYYKGTNEFHIGPIAEDFYSTFQTGDQENPSETQRYISSVDPAGIALIGIQELTKKNEEQAAKIKALETRLEQLEKLLVK